MRLVFSSLFLQLHILTAKVQKNAKNCLFSAIFLGMFNHFALKFYVGSLIVILKASQY